ncbi:MAG: tryptophan synthase subunit alpha [Bacteroides thetaiotaomicron]
MNRINQLFNSNKKDILSIYFCAGDPALDGTVNVIRTLEKHGVSMIEIGFPFSDPMADGIVIQNAATQALRKRHVTETPFRTITKHSPGSKHSIGIYGILKPYYAVRI